MLYWKKTPKWVQKLVFNAVFRQNAAQKQVFLTFDDGPTAQVTPFILDLLSQYRAKATFFCIGKQVELFSRQFEQIIAAGHTVGNHSYSHLHGRQTSYANYMADVARCEAVFEAKLFRPPYGQLTLRQYWALQKKYTIVLWEIMNGDFDPQTTPQQCLDNVVQNLQNGSIIVLHDQERIAEKIYDYLPKLMAFLHAEGYKFEKL